MDIRQNSCAGRTGTDWQPAIVAVCLALVAGVALGTSRQALADQAASTASSDRFDLGVVEVTARPDDLDVEFPGVERITVEDMRRHDLYNVTDAVNLLPGVMIENIGNRNERVVFIRGFDSRQIPLFMDGIPVYVPYNGSIDLGRFTTFQLSEIQVTKAFTSVLYGPNTLGGSINLVSRRPTERFEGDVLAGVGFDDNWVQNVYRAAANFGTNQDSWYLQGGASVLDRDHFRVSGDYTPGGAENGTRRVNSDAKDTSVNLKVGFTPNATDEYSLAYFRQDGEKGVPPYGGQFNVAQRFWRWPDYDKESLYFLSRTSFGSGHYLRLRAYYDEFYNLLQSFDDATFTTQNRGFAFDSTYDDYTWGAGAELGFDLGPSHFLKVAASIKRDFHNEQDDVGEPWEKFGDLTTSVAAEDTWSISDATTFIGGVGWNYQESRRADQKDPAGNISPFPTGSDSAPNVQLGLFHDLDDVTSTHVTIGRKTRFPTISNRFSGRFGSALPNPDLEAETSTNYEIGVDREHGRFTYGAALFRSDLDDAIQSVAIAPDLCANPPCTQPQNIEEQENKGVEVYVDFAITASLDLHFDYTYLDRENTTQPDVKPIDTPRHKAFAYLSYRPIDTLELIASAVYEDERISESTGVRGVDSFTVANLRGSWLLRNDFAVEFGINNILDEDFAYDEGFPEPGRNYYMNLQYRFKE
jgi:iron complex outermembrane recepter protein